MNYEFKYKKYKTKYLTLKSQDNMDTTFNQYGGQSNKYILNSAIIYSDKCFVNVNSSGIHNPIIGFDASSVIANSSNNDFIETEVYQQDDMNSITNKHPKVIVNISDRHHIQGIVDVANPNLIVLHDDKHSYIIHKWQSIQSKSKFMTSQIHTNKEAQLSYFIDTLNWMPYYYLYLDSDDINNTGGKFYLSAKIQNNTGSRLDIESLILMSGATRLDTDHTHYSNRELSFSRQAQINSSNNEIMNTSLAELLTFNIDNKTLNLGTTHIKLSQYNLEKLDNIYLIDASATSPNNTEYVHAKYGYKISVNNQHNINEGLPSGILNIYANKNNINVLIASIKIPQTSKNEPIEIMLGSTPRIRSNLIKQQSTNSIDDGYTKKHRGTKITDTTEIHTINIYGTIINDTKSKQIIKIQDYIGYERILNSKTEYIIQNGYIIWKISCTPGKHNVDIEYIKQI